jgi:hypothetical protein
MQSLYIPLPVLNNTYFVHFPLEWFLGKLMVRIPAGSQAAKSSNVHQHLAE